MTRRMKCGMADNATTLGLRLFHRYFPCRSTSGDLTLEGRSHSGRSPGWDIKVTEEAVYNQTGSGPLDYGLRLNRVKTPHIAT
ncbi:hypothetical protein EVAR_98117_1 [Eumeta japonica]|uniref:Uncharacterized protein n=1 Tax=Eumeta variegata TaxID=151549 RepID=A0A4C2A5N9_EUMVA|nr:hypothetical protein EVAR_98117_1 [Eumeta japonica]